MAKNRQEGLKWEVVGKEIVGKKKKKRQEWKEKEDKSQLHVVATRANGNGQGQKLEQLVQFS